MNDPLLAPLKVGAIPLRNRVVFGAHTTSLAEGGKPGERMTRYYTERGLGGASMIVIEPVPVSLETRYSTSNLVSAGEAPAAYRAMVAAVKATGARMIHQLIHLGSHVDAALTERAACAPMDTASWVASMGVPAATDAELSRVGDAFVARAMEAHDVGFDGIELFANYHGLIEQTWTAAAADCAGNRFDAAAVSSFSARICRTIRERCGPDFIIGMAVSAMPETPGILSLDQIAEIIRWHDAQGLMDYVSCGSGGYRDTSSIVPSALHEQQLLSLALARRLRKLGTRAVIQLETSLHRVEAAREAITSGAADLVSLVRPQICDPEWVVKLQRNAATRIRPCTACNQACIGRRARDMSVSCVTNPRAGREFRISKPPAVRGYPGADIVGGGVAGMEAARTLAERDFSVVLYERDSKLGGQLAPMCKLPGLERYELVLDWYRQELALLGVEVRLEQEVTLSDVCAGRTNSSARIAIVATGSCDTSAPFQRAWPSGVRMPDSHTGLPAHHMLQAPPAPGTSILLVDDTHHHRGLTLACWLQETGARVQLVTSQPVAGAGLAGTGMQPLLRRRFRMAGGVTHADCVLTAWDEGRGRLRNLISGAIFDVPADNLVWSCPSARSNYDIDGLLSDAQQSGIQLRFVGDARSERDAELAILEAHLTALEIETKIRS